MMLSFLKPATAVSPLASWAVAGRSRIAGAAASAAVVASRSWSSTAPRNSEAGEIHKFAVSQSALDTVKATLPLVGQAGTEFTTHFYGRMFKAHPELLNVFNQTNQELGGQPKKLLKTVALAAQCAIDTGELPVEAIKGICHKHAALGVTAEQYGVVGEHLLGTIEDLLTKDQGVLDAWAELYGDIAGVFITREQEIKDEAASKPGGWTGTRKFFLEKKQPLSSTITRFRFRPVDGKPVTWYKPGQYTTIWVPVEEESKYGKYTLQPRHYTLNVSNDPNDAHSSLSISVKRQGLVSRILHEAMPDVEYDFSAPFGCFDLSGVESLWLSELDAPIVLISAGVGITPVLSMLESIYVTRPATWLHAAESGNHHAYRDRLREISAIRSGDLQRRVWYTHPSAEDGPPGGNETVGGPMWNLSKYHYKGLMELKDPDFDQTCLHLNNDLTQYYLCGPEAFMEKVADDLLSFGIKMDHIHSEGFK